MEEAQAAADVVRRRHRLRGAVVEEAGGESSRRPGIDGHRAGVEEARASHPSSVGSGFEADGSDASVENGASVDDARIQTDGTEQPRASEWIQASRRPGAIAAVLLAY